MSERYGHEKAMAEPGVAYTGPLEYVVDREFKDGHPPRRFTATEAAAELNRLHAEVERLLADAARRFVLIHLDGYDFVFVVPFGCEAKARKHIKAWEEWDQSMANACGRPRRIEDAGPEPLRPEWLLEVDLSKDKLTVAIPQVTRGN